MQVSIWKVIVLIPFWTKIGFGYETTLEKDTNNDEVFLKESLPPDPNDNILEVKDIYYTTGPKSRIFVEYPKDDDLHLFSKKVEMEEITPIENDEGTFQPWSILWYIGSFGGLVVFFLIVSCSEWCCRTHISGRNSRNTMSNTSTPSDLPPPAYDLFAPPSYDSLCRTSTGEKSEYDVYVVPVHTLETMRENQSEERNDLDSPPSYSDQRRDEVVLNVSFVQDLGQPKTEPETSTHT